MSRSGSRPTTLGRGSFTATSIGTWRSESWSYFRVSRVLMCRRSPRGFAVIMAEDVPDVSTSVIPPGESNGLLFVKFNRKSLSSRFMGSPLPEFHHLRRRQPQYNPEVKPLTLPSFYGERFIIDSLFLGNAARFAAAGFVFLLREPIFFPFFGTVAPFFSSATYRFSTYTILDCRCFNDYYLSRLVCMISASTR